MNEYTDLSTDTPVAHGDKS